jgi:enediyne biosynthesis protein E4
MMALFYNKGDGTFHDMAPDNDIGRDSKTFSIFGCLLVDVDNDGWLDIFTASGHIDEQIDGIRGTAHALRPLLFQNRQKEFFKEIGRIAGSDLQKPLVGRGLASADYDLDGDLDLVITTNGGAPCLLKNTSPRTNNSIRLVLRGGKSNRDGIGTLVKVKLGETGLRRAVRSGSSYLSQSELPLTLGLGKLKVAEQLSIYWPSGKKTVLKNVAGNQILTVDENKGLFRTQLLPTK